MMCHRGWKAFNPLIPGEAGLSGIPIAVIRFVLFNKGNQFVSASICGTLQNFIGEDGSSGAPVALKMGRRLSRGRAAAHARQHKEASFSKKFTLSERVS